MQIIIEINTDEIQPQDRERFETCVITGVHFGMQHFWRKVNNFKGPMDHSLYTRLKGKFNSLITIRHG